MNLENIFKNLQKYDDNFKFDKEKFKKPYPFYGFLHDKYIIPPIEEHKKKKIEGNPNLKSSRKSNCKIKINESWITKKTI